MGCFENKWIAGCTPQQPPELCLWRKHYRIDQFDSVKK